MKTLLIFPPLYENSLFTIRAPQPPLGIAYLSAALKKEGFESKAVDMSGYTLRMIDDVIRKEEPDIVGISCFTDSRKGAFEVIKLTKEINPAITVIAGGPHASFMYEQMLSNFPIDFVVIGEGERTIVELVKCLKENGDPTQIKGLAFEKDQRIIKTGRREPITDLDSIQFPDISSFDFNDYINIPGYDQDGYYTKKYGGPIINHTMITSRGCTNACQFCSTSAFWGRFWRQRSVRNIIDEMEVLVSKGAKFITFLDDTFTVNQKRTQELCEEIIKRKLDVDWVCETRVNHVNAEMLAVMKKAGCSLILYGLESGSDKILKQVGKNIELEQARSALVMTREARLRCGLFLMVGNPGESCQTIFETIKFLKDVPFTFTMTALARVYPNTELYQIAKQRGIVDDAYWLQDAFAPYYTGEKSLLRLRMYQMLLTSYLESKKGIPALLKFLSKKVVRNPFKLLSTK